MVDHTHYWGIFGDGHVRGRVNATNIDPVAGQLIEVVLAPTPAAELGVVVRGATSGSAGIIRAIITPTSYVIEMINNPLGLPGFAFAQNNTGPLTGETINFDNGGTAVISFLGSSQQMPLLAQRILQSGDSRLSATVPADVAVAENPYWHREAKAAQKIVVLTSSLAGTAPYFRKGDRCTTPTGACTIAFVDTDGVDLFLSIVRKTGTISATQTLTNTTLGGGTTGTISVVESNPQQGTWLPYATMPSIKGLGTYYPTLGSMRSAFEFVPAPPSVGPENRLIHHLATHHGAAASVNDRGFKLLTVTVPEIEPANAALGGVVVQVVKCSGTFPTNWVVGETVTGGGSWSGKVLGFHAGNKFLYVIETNGNTLTASTVTGGTSGATATSTGAAVGHAKGSSHWNNFAAEVTSARAAPNALHLGSAERWEGLALMHHETELSQHSTVLQCPWPTETQALAAWTTYIADLRTLLGRADLPITLWAHRLESQSNVVPFGSYIVREWKRAVRATVPGVTLLTSDELFEMETGSLQYLRHQDYIDLGEHLWRHLKFGQVSVPVGGYRLLPVGISWGQSQKTGFAAAATIMSIDSDPDLWPSAAFRAGVSTIDSNLLSWNAITRTMQPYACDQNENTSWGTFTGSFGPVTPLAQRMKRRFSEDPIQSAPFCVFKFTVPGSACSPTARDAAGCWDPLQTSTATALANCTVTVFAASGSVPQRGRFTAVAGTFIGGSWQTGTSIRIAGSQQTQGLGGNNSPQWTTQLIYAIAPDGAWVEFINGTFAADAVTRSYTFSIGPPPIWPEFTAQWNAFVSECAKLGWIPRVAYIEGEQGESDLATSQDYEAPFTRVWQAMEALCAPRFKGGEPVAKCITMVSSQTPWGTDVQLAQIREIQSRVATSVLTNCVKVDPSDLPQEIDAAGTVVRQVRQDNGIHRTMRGNIAAGFRVDAALATLGASKGIPPHPKGELAVDFGAVDGGTTGSGADAGGEDSPGTPGTGGLIVEDGSGVDDAESICSVEQLDAFWAKNGAPAAVTAATDTQKAAALRRATREWFEGVCGGFWRGVIEFQNQRLSFPRIGCYDDEGRLVPQGTIPAALIEAVAIVAGDVLAGGTILSNGVEQGPVTRETKRGLGFEQTFEYAPGGFASPSVRRVRAAEALVYPYIQGNRSGVSRS